MTERILRHFSPTILPFSEISTVADPSGEREFRALTLGVEAARQRRRTHDPEHVWRVKETALRLFAYCQARNWTGYDPYDALNSDFLGRCSFLRGRFARLVLTQFLKRAPINLRWVLRVPPTQNPKGLALFLGAFLKLSTLRLLDEPTLVKEIIRRIEALRAPETNYWCWGYNFPWQTRTVFVPRGAANLVCTVFVAEALLDSFDALNERRFLEMAVSAGEYLVNELHWTGENGVSSLAYGLPECRVPVHNANLLGAALLCRLYKHTGRKDFLRIGTEIARYSAGRQRADGSWFYGELPSQCWIDNFHTGYNLCALRNIGRDAGTDEFEAHIGRGFEFYRRHFFREDGAPRYFHDRTYPIDVHCAAQSIITLLRFKDLHVGNLDLARSVCRWSLENMWNPKGCFYYQKCSWYTNRISYMRWGQAWMLVALAELLETEMALT